MKAELNRNKDKSYAVVQEGALTEAALEETTGFTYTPQTIELLFGGDNVATWNYPNGAFMALPRLLLEHSRELSLLGTETPATLNALGVKSEAFWSQIDWLNGLEDCAAVGGSKALPFATAVDAFEAGSNRADVTACYCAARERVQAGTLPFIEDRMVKTPRREAEAAFASKADVTFIIAGANHFPEIKRAFDEKGVHLEAKTVPGLTLGEVSSLEPLPDPKGLCGKWN